MERYKNSELLLQKALELVPTGSQTFSKSHYAYPRHASPMFLERGKGSAVWDVDGHQYIDFVNSLLCVSLGYADEDINAAVMAQLQNGVSFSLPHRLEIEVAELLVDCIPSAEMVRFAKNGTDVTSAAIRLARAYTGREHVAVGGYHGWQDWYIGSTTRDLGVPGAVKALTHTFKYNDLTSLETLFSQFPKQIAAVILEPMTFDLPKPGYLDDVKKLCEREGALLIFDEMITGFRFALGGAQEYFNVVPHLSTFGKGMANGFPLSAIVGQRDIMKSMDDIFFSGTFGGETMSLAAAKATLLKMRAKDVAGDLIRKGEALKVSVEKLIREQQLEDYCSISGFPSWTLLAIKDTPNYTGLELKSLFIQECALRGILMNATHNLSYAHSDQDIQRLLEVYGEVLPILKEVSENKLLASRLKGDVLKPVFKVR
ncbi:MAG: aminotransferase class III-fold pyridoxal phosphate-dependent enzyme [Hahellaceae bacterium]|nr:aminotransferase class III-fold pyridoxal phosphate-dependent enzyme [Hahellaceae bacterium]